VTSVRDRRVTCEPQIAQSSVDRRRKWRPSRRNRGGRDWPLSTTKRQSGTPGWCHFLRRCINHEEFNEGSSGAALVVAAGSAYTAANTMTGATITGYGNQTATGVTVTTTTYTPLETDASLLKEVVWKTTTDIDTNYTATMTMTVSGAPVVKSCAITSTVTPWTITCDADDAVITNVSAVALTVTPTLLP